MNHKKLGIALLVFVFVGLGIFVQILIQYEEKVSVREIESQGSAIVSLIALHSIQDLAGDKHDFILKALTEYTTTRGLAYCFINDANGKPIVTFAPGNIGSEIPDGIRMNSLATMGLTYQSFKTKGSKHRIYECSKTVLEKGEKTGTVRIGLRTTPISIMSMERVSLIAMLSFFIISAIVIAYYGFVRALRPLEKFWGSMVSATNAQGAGNYSPRGFGITPMVEDFQRSMTQSKRMLKKMEMNNRELASKIGVLKFEKNQVLNILNSVNFGIVTTDMHDNISHINDYMMNLLNTNRPDAIDSPLQEVLRRDEITSFIAEQQGLEQPRNNRHLDTTFPELAPGETYRISCSYLRDGDKAPIGKMILVINVTREKVAS
ncbi:MAG: PAS domain-containing protein, partial [Deltaproteobacteria bacterium]